MCVCVCLFLLHSLCLWQLGQLFLRLTCVSERTTKHLLQLFRLLHFAWPEATKGAVWSCSPCFTARRLFRYPCDARGVSLARTCLPNVRPIGPIVPSSCREAEKEVCVQGALFLQGLVPSRNCRFLASGRVLHVGMPRPGRCLKRVCSE